MKKMIFSNLFMAAAAIVLLAACGGKGETQSAAEPADTMALEPMKAEESELEFYTVSYSTSSRYAEYEANILCPKGGDELVRKAMCASILKLFGVKKPTGDEDFKHVLTTEGKKFLAQAKRDIEEIEGYDEEDFEKCSYLSNITVSYRSEKFVTLSVSGSEYQSGAAHGMPWKALASIDLSTGKRLEWDDIIKPGMKAKLKAMLKKAVINQYFDGHDVFDEYFTFDLPSIPPALTKNGVWFGYGVYEIASYADGFPEATIGYEQLSDYLTDNAKQLADK